MGKLLNIIGNIAALAGILICLIAGLIRLTGGHHILGFETMTAFMGGIAIMVLACLIKLYQLEAK